MIDLKNCRAFALEPGTPDQRLETPERIVLDLMMEIEALRTAMIALESANDPGTQDDHVLDEPAAGVLPWGSGIRPATKNAVNQYVLEMRDFSDAKIKAKRN